MGRSVREQGKATRGDRREPPARGVSSKNDSDSGGTPVGRRSPPSALTQAWSRVPRSTRTLLDLGTKGLKLGPSRDCSWAGMPLIWRGGDSLGLVTISKAL